MSITLDVLTSVISPSDQYPSRSADANSRRSNDHFATTSSRVSGDFTPMSCSARVSSRSRLPRQIKGRNGRTILRLSENHRRSCCSIAKANNNRCSPTATSSTSPRGSIPGRRPIFAIFRSRESKRNVWVCPCSRRSSLMVPRSSGSSRPIRTRSSEKITGAIPRTSPDGCCPYDRAAALPLALLPATLLLIKGTSFVRSHFHFNCRRLLPLSLLSAFPIKLASSPTTAPARHRRPGGAPRYDPAPT